MTSQSSQTVSLCLIVRNEESNLARCLNSVHDLFHEIIVVDTGSTDRTCEIAKEHGARSTAYRVSLVRRFFRRAQ